MNQSDSKNLSRVKFRRLFQGRISREDEGYQGVSPSSLNNATRDFIQRFNQHQQQNAQNGTNQPFNPFAPADNNSDNEENE